MVVALARLGDSRLTPAARAHEILAHRKDLDFVIDAIARRAEAHNPDLLAEESADLRAHIRARVKNLLDDWETIARDRGLCNTSGR